MREKARTKMHELEHVQHVHSAHGVSNMTMMMMMIVVFSMENDKLMTNRAQIYSLFTCFHRKIDEL